MFFNEALSGSQKKIKKIIEEFFKKSGFNVIIEISFFPENVVLTKIKTSEPKIMIGQSGQMLIEIQRLLRIMVKKAVKEDVKLELDVNDYKKKKFEYLKDFARSVADKVFLSKKDKVLDPMPSYERRVIHMELANRSDVITESEGEGDDRRVVVKTKQ